MRKYVWKQRLRAGSRIVFRNCEWFPESPQNTIGGMAKVCPCITCAREQALVDRLLRRRASRRRRDGTGRVVQ